jgi:Ser/Thr protein kinase RdoA (MazF antagonist)
MVPELAAWGEVTVLGRLGGGNRQVVLEGRRGGERVAVRRSGRSVASLGWEIELLDRLAGAGFLVPVMLPALDGRRHVNGVVVQAWLDGTPPGPGDWPAVAAELGRLHAVTAGWPQRPGAVSTSDLIQADRGGDVDLTELPAEGVSACRRAWAALAGRPRAVVHGDPGPGNIRMSRGGAGLLDWDEARVDYTALDLADLPGQADRSAWIAVRAWEAASGWRAEPDYARGQLALLLGTS